MHIHEYTWHQAISARGQYLDVILTCQISSSTLMLFIENIQTNLINTFLVFRNAASALD